MQSSKDKSQGSGVLAREGACPCCSGRPKAKFAGMVSGFLASRAFGETASPVEVAQCGDCGFMWSRRGLSDEQAARLYAGYRGDEYFAQRHRFEPWYSRAKNDSIGSEEQMVGRRRVLGEALSRAAAVAGSRPEGVAMDFGGDRGQMLKDLPDGGKWVFDVSGNAMDPWARSAEDLDSFDGRCDLVLNCQVLEHVNLPSECLARTAKLAKPGGWVYVEVPDEMWNQRQWLSGRVGAWWLAAVAKRPLMFKALDFASTASRLAFGRVPFFGFWAMREHLNFFTEDSLFRLMRGQGLSVLWIGKTASGISAVGRKD